MTKKIPKNQSVRGLKPDCLSFGEVLAQSFAVIAPTTIPASNIGLIVALSGVGSMEQGIDAIHAKFEAENAIYGGVRLNTVSIDNNGFD